MCTDNNNNKEEKTMVSAVPHARHCPPVAAISHTVSALATITPS